MATRRRSGRLLVQPKRRSQRLGKGNFLECKNSPALDVATPRTVFRKVLQTQPIVSPVVPEKADTPKPAETVFKFPSRNATDSNIEISLTGPVPEETLYPVLPKRGKKKKVRLSEFERAVDKQLPSTTPKSFSDQTSLTRSLQVTLGTPVTPPSDGKRGLTRRPKSYKGVNVMTFEGGMEQNLLQVKGSQNHLVKLHASVLSNATETINADTELFAQSQLSGQVGTGLHVLPSELASAEKSVSQKTMLSPAADLQTPQQPAESDTDAGMTQQGQKDISMPESECVDGIEGVLEEKVYSPRKEQQDSEMPVEGGMIDSDLKEMLSPDTERAAGMDSMPQQRTLSLRGEQQGSLHGDLPVERRGSLHGDRPMERRGSLHGNRPVERRGSLHGDRPMEQQGSLHGDRPVERWGSLHGDRPVERRGSLHGDHLVELHLSPEKDQLSDICTPKSSTPVNAKLPDEPVRGLRAFLQAKATKRSVKMTVEHIIEELDKNMAPCVEEQGASEANLEEEPFPSEEAPRISQRTGVGTPWRSVSRQEPEQVEREAANKAIQLSGDESKPREVSDLENEADEVEMEPEVEDLSEAEMDSENNEPPVKTPAFVRAKAFQCTPLLSSPCTLKSAASKSASEQPSKKLVPKESKKARREKRQPALSSCWVKKLFSHYVKMPVAKDAFQAVERCVSLYFKHLSEDLEAYTNHARRKTVELADLELLMRRQGLITDKIPLNVLIERHLPLEYRKLLIPVATSGNKVIPFN
ncbi:centromere protein T [Heteronotia binoei]|uniref:centromere protein T n=1 Tax=Heteronotia binoei TaxID=13085 RepID=UPI00292CEA41|nr:centromere protein T [Heteronotia binoei]